MKRLADQNLYEILDVREDAPDAEIREACERALLLYGPGSLATYTLMTPDEAALLTSRIEEARATLLDPGARARYDERLQQAPAEAAAGAAKPAGPAFGSLPPVIPAVKPAPLPPAAEEEEDEVRPPVLLAAAVEVAGEPEGEGEPEAPASPAGGVGVTVPPLPAPEPPPPPRPILLEREVPSRAAAAPEPAPLAAPPAAPPAAPAALPVPPEGAEWTGDALRQVREARGLSVQQIADRTKVTRHHIENIEGDRFAALPAPVYLRGILLSMARELRLDGQKVSRSYLERAAAAAKPK